MREKSEKCVKKVLFSRFFTFFHALLREKKRLRRRKSFFTDYSVKKGRSVREKLFPLFSTFASYLLWTSHALGGGGGSGEK